MGGRLRPWGTLMVTKCFRFVIGIQSTIAPSQCLQRLKGAIDARIAEELDRQRTQESASPSNSTPGTRRPAPRTASPSKRSRSSKDGEKGPLLKGPEPAEFEPEFVIDDDEVPSRTGTPRPAQEKPDSTGPPPYGPRDQLAPSEGTEAGKPDGGGAALTPVPPELPKDVRLKLRKLEKLESRYNGMNVNTGSCSIAKR